MRLPRPVALLAAACLLAGTTAVQAQRCDAAKLRADHASLQAALASSPFRQPLRVQSQQTSKQAEGDVYAVLPHAFRKIAGSLRSTEQWCEVLGLHLNVKRCRPGPAGVVLSLGTKHAQPVERAFPLELQFALDGDQADCLRVALHADKGPMGTRDYDILFEAVPLSADTTFVHFDYSVGYGLMARMAMSGYFATLGSGKQGFSTEGGRPVGGERAAVERNALRYHLAVVAYLDSLAAEPAARMPRRLQAWFDATERYPQLHEIERDEYLEMKQHELSPGAGAPR